MSDANGWYIVKQTTGHCQIVAAPELQSASEGAEQSQWGPYASEAEAIARRVGLIRAGKCQPT